MTRAQELEHGGGDLRKSEKTLAQRQPYRFTDGAWIAGAPPHGPQLCGFVQDRRDCINPAQDGYQWCRFHLEAHAYFYKVDWLVLTFDQRCDLTRGFSVKWYPYVYQCELRENGPKRVVELIVAWNAHYLAMEAK